MGNYGATFDFSDPAIIRGITYLRDYFQPNGPTLRTLENQPITPPALAHVYNTCQKLEFLSTHQSKNPPLEDNAFNA